VGKRILISLLLGVLFFAAQMPAQSTDKLWYKQPAKYFEESLVLGNGKLGATVFGDPLSETVYLNDITLWSGEPVDPNMDPEAYKNLPEIREALKNEDYPLADSLNRKLQGKYSSSYAPLGTLKIDFQYNNIPDALDTGILRMTNHYYRELDISRAVSKVNFELNGIHYSREYFVSNPDKIIVIKLSSSHRGALSFHIRFESLLKNEVSARENQLKAVGYAPLYAAPSYFGDVPNAVIFDQEKGTRFISLLQVQTPDGKIVASDSLLSVKSASEAYIYVSLATSFNGFDKDPVREGADYEVKAREQLDGAVSKTYEKLKSDHVEDYQYFFNRVKLDLGSTTAPDGATDERLRRYADGDEDKNLEILYFNYGRYLLISSSRTPEVPANLQGLWNPYIRPPWSSNYTLNINAEENYWLTENTNLTEMHQPMLSFIHNLAATGKVTARTFYGSGGWAACHNSDIWAMSNPVGDFGSGYPGWANWNMGGVWLSTHLWEHYAFTRDQDFLRNDAYPLMKGAAQFCLDWLVEDKDGYLITSPCTSPENNYITDKGYHGATFYGGTADLAMIRELFTQTIAAESVLNNDEAFSLQLGSALSRLYPFQVGQDGSLQEWYYDWKDEDPKHRHQTHLFGLFPGHQITPATTPELALACRRALEIKGDETTGWSKGWRINLWARLGDGDHAYKMFRELLHYVEPDGMRTNYSGGGGTYPNLFDAHPPFQIDGNFGGTAAIVEMLLQSTADEIILLPALPGAWESGQVSGICARGGFEVSMSWSAGVLDQATVLNKSGYPCTIIYGGKRYALDAEKGKTTVIEL
jgi:alpha-L-fucosidase 2